MDIRVIGAGAWGTALAINAARHGHVVTLWARDAAQAQAMQRERRNSRYLGAAEFPANLSVSDGDLSVAVQGADLIVIGTDSFTIQGEPIRDRERLISTLDLRPS